MATKLFTKVNVDVEYVASDLDQIAIPQAYIRYVFRCKVCGWEASISYDSIPIEESATMGLSLAELIRAHKHSGE